MSEDIYKESSHIADLLDRDGHKGSAQEIRDAMDYGSTATEILMQLRWRLRVLRDSQIFQDDISRKKVCRLLSGLDLALGDQTSGDR
jgi:hypothetical protein